MKKVSVIVPVYNVEEYLEKCLISLVNQTLKDIEIILVDDGSTDNSRNIIDNYKKTYPEMIKVYSIENSGAAKARKYALKHVTGEYIGFVDSDDYISEEMYEKLYNKAKEKESDIVCCNYYRVINDEKFNIKKFGNKKILAEDIFDKNIYESNLLFDEVPYLWNKIFKTEMIEKNNINFCDELSIYEDLLFTYQAFSKANKISIIGEQLYYYTVSREESLTNTLTKKRFDIFQVSKELVNYYKSINKYDELEHSIIYVILKHIYVVLEKQTLKKEKRIKIEYINRVFKFLDNEFPNWRKNEYFELQSKDKKKYTSKLYWKISAILGINIINKKKKIKNMIKKAFNFLMSGKIGNTYIKQTKKRIDYKSIFIFSQQGNNLNGNMFYILKELANNNKYDNYKIYIGYSEGNKEKFVKLLKSYNIFNRVKLVKNQTNRFAKILAKSKYLFTDTSMPIYFIKRKEQVYLNTWHGTPLKTLGKSTENDFFDIANVQKNFVISDYLLYPSEFMKDIMIEDYMLKGIASNKIMLCGYPRNEIFLRDDMQKAKEENGLDKKTVIAYMPTWRGSVRDIDVEKQINIAQKHIKEISERLKENQILYVNMHPFIGNKIDLKEYKNVELFPENLETYDFLSLCDILITDYSSVFFDFAVTNKKIILFAYDEKEYFENRGVYLSLEELPFPKVRNIDELIEEINLPIQYDSSNFLEKFCKYDRNNNSKLICETIFLNKENKIKIIDMPESKKENVLVYLGDFNPNNNTKDFIKVVNNTKESKYNYYISYITKRLRPNKEFFRKIINKVKFYGQLGSNANISRKDTILLKILDNKKCMYNRFRKIYDNIYKLELKRIFQNIEFKAIILYGDIDCKKIYELSNMQCKKILYIKDEKYFNKKVNKDIYNNFDYILTTNQKTYNTVKEYCKQERNIKIIQDISKLEDFNAVIK